MRKLTLKREKSFVGSLANYKVYLEDPENGDLVIKGTNCRKLGTIANGSDAVFEIGDGAAKLFVIGDKLAKEYCNDFYQIPEGTEDIVLTGKAKYDPAAGNPFYFDGNEGNAEAMDNRKKSKKRGLVVLIIALIVGILVGIGFSVVRSVLKKKANEQPKEFSKGGMTITLTKAFKLKDEKEFDFFAESSNATVSGLKKSAAAYGASALSAKELAQYMSENFGTETSGVKTKDDLIFFDYLYQESNNTFKYRVYIFKQSGNFWTVIFGMPEKTFNSMEDTVNSWAGTIKFQ